MLMLSRLGLSPSERPRLPRATERERRVSNFTASVDQSRGFIALISQWANQERPNFTELIIQGAMVSNVTDTYNKE